VLAASRDKIKSAGRKLDLALYTYFGDAAPLYEKLVTLPVDILGFDFTSSPTLLETIASAGSSKSLALVCGRLRCPNRKFLSSRQAHRPLIPKITGDHVFLGTSCRLGIPDPADVAFA